VSESSEMRHAKLDKLEWGYPPPRPNFIRRVRTALIATAVGAAAGGIVVFSFVDRSVDKDFSDAAGAIYSSAIDTDAAA